MVPLSLLHEKVAFFTATLLNIISPNVQEFVTDLAATSGRVRDIISEAERMMKTGHSQARDIQTRQHQLNQRYVSYYVHNIVTSYYELLKYRLL